MGRWLCIDHGTKRFGIAAGDARNGIASPLTQIPAQPEDDAIQRIVSLAGEYQAAGIVVGWPLNMDDSEGPQGKLARDMAARLAAVSGLDVRMWDERLSSFTADETLAGIGTRKKRKARQDSVAAAVILQDFFACGGPESAPMPTEVQQ